MSEPTNMGIVEAKPKREEIVTAEVLSSHQNVSLLARGFAGMANPTSIWQEMVQDSPTAFTYYRELEEKDDDVGGQIEMLKLLVLARERQVVAADESSEADKVAEFVREQLASIPDFHQVLDALLDAPGHGFAISEILWDPSEGQVGISDIKDCPQELFSFGAIGQPQIGPLRFRKDGFAYDGGELVPESKFLTWTYRPRSRNRRGRPLLRAVFWPSWFKRQALRLWLRFGEKGPGTAAVKYPQGASDDEKSKALAAAEAMIEKVAIAIPENFGLIEELLTSARSQNPAVYEKLVNRMELAITRRIMGQTLTTRGSEGGAGSYALGGVHEDILFLKIREMAGSLETVVNDQLIRRLVMWNFGPKAPMPKWSIDKESAKDLTALSQVDSTLQKMGMPLGLKAMQKKYGVDEIQGDDVALVPQSTTAADAQSLQARDQQIFNEQPAEVKRATADINALMKQLKAEAGDAYVARIKTLAENPWLGGAM